VFSLSNLPLAPLAARDRRFLNPAWLECIVK